SLPPDVDVREREDRDEEEKLDEAVPRELVEDHGERIQEDDLDVEEDEQHRREVEADREAPGVRRSARDAGLERHRPRAQSARRPLREHEAHQHHRRRDQDREGSVEEERKPVVEHLEPPAGGTETKIDRNPLVKRESSVTKSPVW